MPLPGALSVFLDIIGIVSGWEVQILWITSACTQILEILNKIYHHTGITLGISFLFMHNFILLSCCML
jgi:hypothetical protein